MKILAIAFLFLLSTSAGCTVPALSAGCGSSVAYSSTNANGSKVELILGGPAAERAPKWKPGEGEPPVSVAKASSIALAWAKENYTRFDAFEIQSINLSSYGCDDRWYYRIDFAPVIEGNTLYGGQYVAAILMDGTVVGPTSTKKGSN